MAEIDSGALSFKSVMDNEQINAAIKETLRRIQGLSDGTAAGMDKVDASFKMAEGLVKNFATITKNSGVSIEAEYQKVSGGISAAFDTLGYEIQKNQDAIKSLTAEYERLGMEANKSGGSYSTKLGGGGNLTKEQAELKSGIDLLKQANAEYQKHDQSLLKLNKDLEAHKDALMKNNDAEKRLTTQQRLLINELAKMDNAGLSNTEAFRKMAEEAGQLTDTLGDVRKRAQILGDDEATFKGLMSGLTGVAGGFSAVTGAVSLFSEENENLQKIMVKVQSVMAITIGLQQVAETLNKDSYFRVKTLTQAKNLLAAATNRLTVALGGSTIAAKVLMATLTLGLSVAITALIVLWNKYSASQNKAAEEAKKLVEIEKDARETMLRTRIEIEQTKKELESFTGTKEQEKQKVDELNKKYGESFGYYKTLAEWYSVLLEKGEDYIQMLFLQAKAQSLINKAVESDNQVNEINAKGKESYRPVWGDGGKINMFFGGDNKDNTGSDPAELSFNKAKKEGEDLRDSYLRQAEELQKGIKEIRKKGIGGFKEIVIPGKGDGADKKDPFTIMLEERKKRYSEYSKWINSTDENIRKTAPVEFADILKDGNTYLEYLQKLKQDTALTKEQIHQISGEIAGETGKTMLDIFKESLAEQLNNAKTVIEQLNVIQKIRSDLKDNDPLKVQKTEILDESGKQAEETRKQETMQVLREYADMNDRLTDLKVQYFNELALLNHQKETALSAEEKQRIDRTVAYRKQKYNEDVQNLLSATVNAKVRMIELERDRTLLNISNKKYLFEADRQKDILEIQKETAEETLAQFNKLQEQAPTGELAFEIERITLEIEAMNAELKKMPNEKFREALSGLQKITGALGNLEGEAGEIFSGISSGLDNIKVVFDEMASKTDKVSAGISAVVDIINTVTSASAKRKQAEKEFYQNSIALAHEYALSLNDVLRTQSELSGNGFVTDYAGRINDGFKALSDAASGYQETLGKLSEGKAKIDLKNAVDWGNVGKSALSGLTAGAAIGSFAGPIGTAVGAVVGGLVGGIVGLFGGKKKKDVTAGLLDVFPELIDGAGNLNKELAQTLINTNQVDDATKQLIQNALDWADAVEEAKAQMQEVVVDLAGDLGNGIRNALVDAFKSGEDASKGMFEAASKSLEDFISNLLYGMMFNDIFNGFKEELGKAMENDGILDEDEIIGAYDNLMNGVESASDDYLKALEIIREKAKERGFNTWEDEDTADKADTSLTGQVKGVTQETASMIGGQMNTIRINQMEATDLLRQQLMNLAAIAQNTSYNRFLQSIDEKLERLNNSGDPLRSQGLS
jgi:hypothetical protein